MILRCRDCSSVAGYCACHIDFEGYYVLKAVHISDGVRGVKAKA